MKKFEKLKNISIKELSRKEAETIAGGCWHPSGGGCYSYYNSAGVLVTVCN